MVQLTASVSPSSQSKLTQADNEELWCYSAFCSSQDPGASTPVQKPKFVLESFYEKIGTVCLQTFHRTTETRS